MWRTGVSPEHELFHFYTLLQYCCILPCYLVTRSPEASQPWTPLTSIPKNILSSQGQNVLYREEPSAKRLKGMTSSNFLPLASKVISGFSACSDDHCLSKLGVNAGERSRNKSVCVPTVTAQCRKSNTLCFTVRECSSYKCGVVQRNESGRRYKRWGNGTDQLITATALKRKRDSGRSWSKNKKLISSCRRVKRGWSQGDALRKNATLYSCCDSLTLEPKNRKSLGSFVQADRCQLRSGQKAMD